MKIHEAIEAHGARRAESLAWMHAAKLERAGWVELAADVEAALGCDGLIGLGDLVVELNDADAAVVLAAFGGQELAAAA